MKRRFFLFSALALSLLVLGWTTLRVIRNHRTRERLQNTLAAQRAGLHRQFLQADLKLSNAPQKRPETGTSAATLAPITPPPFETTKPSPTPASSLSEWLEDPKAQVLWLAQQRAELALSYGPFFQSHRLSAAQIEKLCNAIIDARATNHDIAAVARKRNLPSNDALTQLRETAKAERETTEIEILGTTGFTDLQEYRRSLSVRTFVGKIAGAAALEGIPISREQANQLTSVLANASAGYESGSDADVSRINWKAAELQAQTILSSAQVKLLQTDPPGIGRSRFSRPLIDAIEAADREIAQSAQPKH